MRGDPTVEFTCDRCGARETLPATDRPYGWRIYTQTQLVARDLNGATKADLCGSCDSSLDEWWSQGRLREVQP